MEAESMSEKFEYSKGNAQKMETAEAIRALLKFTLMLAGVVAFYAMLNWLRP